MEPRGALHSTIVWNSRRRGNQQQQRESSEETGALLASEPLLEFHAQPALPVHPALEYEVVADAAIVEEPESSPSSKSEEEEDKEVAAASLEKQSSPRANSSNNNLKLLLAFVFLIISGVGTVVSAKLQAIPMYVQASVGKRCWLAFTGWVNG